jgi:hypothetical protein
MSRLRGSATALKASEVVAARGMAYTIHAYMGICLGIYCLKVEFGFNLQIDPDHDPRLGGRSLTVLIATVHALTRCFRRSTFMAKGQSAPWLRLTPASRSRFE